VHIGFQNILILNFHSDNILPAHDGWVEYCVFHSCFFTNINQAKSALSVNRVKRVICCYLPVFELN